MAALDVRDRENVVLLEVRERLRGIEALDDEGVQCSSRSFMSLALSRSRSAALSSASLQSSWIHAS